MCYNIAYVCIPPQERWNERKIGQIFMIKYLYGKSCYLDGFAKTGKGLWFRDLYTMDKLSNEDIKDDEKSKSAKVTSEEISTISLAGRDFRIAPNTHFDIARTPQRCHVLCLSNQCS